MNEHQNIEWKASWRDEYLKWICGFANSNGGKLYIGKSDKGEIVGISNYKKLMEDIPNKIQTTLGIVCDVNLFEINGKHFIEIEVKPYSIAISYQGKYYYRSGSTKQELKGNSLNEFLLKKCGKTWDDVVESRASLSDIDFKAIESFKGAALKSKRLSFIEDESDLMQILDNLLLVENNQLKRAAILLFGKYPTRFYINSYVKIGRFGETDDDLKYQEIIEGNIFEIADRTLDVLDKKFLISPISYEGIQRIEKWTYPYKAVREAIINSIAHRNYNGAPVQISVYNDKLVFWNEGTLPEGMTAEDLKRKHSSRPYNPVIASVFFKGGLIEAWGRGTIKIVNECIDAGLPEPDFNAEYGGITVTLYRDKYTQKYLIDIGLNERQLKAIVYLKEHSKITSSEYQSFFNITNRTALRDLNELINKDLIQKRGEKKGTYYFLIRK